MSARECASQSPAPPPSWCFVLVLVGRAQPRRLAIFSKSGRRGRGHESPRFDFVGRVAAAPACLPTIRTTDTPLHHGQSNTYTQHTHTDRSTPSSLRHSFSTLRFPPAPHKRADKPLTCAPHSEQRPPPVSRVDRLRSSPPPGPLPDRRTSPLPFARALHTSRTVSVPHTRKQAPKTKKAAQHHGAAVFLDLPALRARGVRRNNDARRLRQRRPAGGARRRRHHLGPASGNGAAAHQRWRRAAAG